VIRRGAHRGPRGGPVRRTLCPGRRVERHAALRASTPGGRSVASGLREAPRSRCHCTKQPASQQVRQESHVDDCLGALTSGFVVLLNTGRTGGNLRATEAGKLQRAQLLGGTTSRHAVICVARRCYPKGSLQSSVALKYLRLRVEKKRRTRGRALSPPTAAAQQATILAGSFPALRLDRWRPRSGP